MTDALKLRAVGEVCDYYRYENMMSSIDSNDVTCLSCGNWDGKKCAINVYDKVVAELEQ